jgi:hypothetical protein
LPFCVCLSISIFPSHYFPLTFPLHLFLSLSISPPAYSVSLSLSLSVFSLNLTQTKHKRSENKYHPESDALPLCSLKKMYGFLLFHT